MNIQHVNERYFEEPLWVMDSECCSKCGAILDYFETDLCGDCLENERYNEEQDTYDGWDNMWHCQKCQLAMTLPAFFAAVSLFAKAAVPESPCKEVDCGQ